MIDPQYLTRSGQQQTNDAAIKERLRKPCAVEDDRLIAILAAMIRQSLLKRAGDRPIEPPQLHADDPGQSGP